MEKQFQKFVEEHLARVKPLRKELYLLHWQYDTTGDESLNEKKKALEKQFLEIYSSKEDYETLKKFEASGKIEKLLLKRQLKRLLNAYGMHQGDKQHISRIVELEAQITSIYNHFRGKIDGKPHNDNQIKQILRREKNVELRKKAWEASKQIGPEVAEKILELVRIRNKSAQQCGYSDYYVMSLTLRELDEKKMFETLGRLAELTNEPFRKIKNELDEEKAKLYGVKVADMRPWHYADPFFQQAPPHGKVEMDHFYSKSNIEQLAIKTYDSINMEIRDILAKSDLYPKDGKCQHAYCTFIDRDTRDIRVLCNLDQSEGWASTTLHEFGHAVYDKYIDSKLPYLLQDPAHILSTEAIAMLMDSLSKYPRWLTDIVGAPAQEVDKVKQELQDQEVLSQFIFIRWGLVMVHFERELYRNPDQNLNKLWWDLVEKFQYVKRPENRNQPDWATKIHIALSPVYYQNYMYGEMVAAQLRHYIRHNIGNGELFNNPKLGEYLISRYFASGAKYSWNKTLKEATGENLNPDYFVKESLHI